MQFLHFYRIWRRRFIHPFLVLKLENKQTNIIIILQRTAVSIRAHSMREQNSFFFVLLHDDTNSLSPSKYRPTNNVSAVTTREKSSIFSNIKSTMGFLTSCIRISACGLHKSQKYDSKRIFAVLRIKLDFYPSVCYKVSTLCEILWW